jgi:hypothetical protein
MNRIPLILFWLAFLLTACADSADLTEQRTATPSASPSPSATPDPVELIQKNIEMQGTLNALQASSYQMAANLTGTYMAPTWDVITQQAAGSATQISSTATAAFIATSASTAQTATAALWTPTPDFPGTLTAAKVAAESTELHVQSVRDELALERDRLMNQASAIIPWAATVVVLVFSLALAWRWSQVRVIQRDLRGDAPLIITGATVYDADRNPGPVLDVSSGRPQAPILAPPEMQAATTSRDQLVDLATRGAAGMTPKPQRQAIAKKMIEQTSLPAPTQSIQVLPPDQARPLLGDVIPGIARDAMQTTKLNAE